MTGTDTEPAEPLTASAPSTVGVSDARPPRSATATQAKSESDRPHSAPLLIGRDLDVPLGRKWLRGDDYLVQVALPNFFFHATMAYAILRHNGVDLGKMDYIGSIPTQEG